MKFRLNVQDDKASTTLFTLDGDVAQAMYMPRTEVVTAPLTGYSINNFGDFTALTPNNLSGREMFQTLATTPPSVPNLLAASDSGRSSTDNITKVVTPTMSGTAAAGNLINLYDGNTFVGKTIASSSGKWSITTIPLADGTHQLSATATDSKNNVSLPSAALAVTIDTKAPAAPGMPDLIAAYDSGVSNTDNITNVSAPTFSGTTEAKAQINLFDSTTNALVGSAVANSKGVWSMPGTILAEGKHVLNAVATDVAGNNSPFSTPLVVTIDTTAPAAPVLAMLASSDSGRSNSDNITNVVTPIFSGVTEAGATVALYADNNTSPVATAIANGKGEWIATTKLAEGLHSLTAKVTDSAGNVSAISAPLSVNIDTTAALAPSTPDLIDTSDTGSSNTDNITNVTTPTFSGKAEAGASIALLDNVSHLVVGKATANSLGEWAITSSTLAQGKHDLSATATDLAGNTSAASSSLIVTIEAIAPTAPSTPDLLTTSDSGSSNTDNITNGLTPVFSGSAQAGVTVSLYDGPGNTNLVGKAVASNTGAWNITSKLGDGVHTLHATATDALNNVSSNSGDLIVTIDTIAPLAPSVPDLQAAYDSGRSNTDNITNLVTPSFSGSAEAGASVVLLDNGKNVGTAIASSTGAWSITSSTLLEGAHSLSASITDVAGNTATSLSALPLTIDTTAPRISLNLPPLTNDNTPTLSGTADVGGGEIQLWYAQTGAAFDKATVDSLGNWSVTLPTIADGTYSVYATQTDLAGNNGTSIVRTGTIDTLAPVVTLNMPTTTKDNTPTIGGTGEAGGGPIQIWNAQNNIVLATATVDASGHWSYTLPTTPDGTYTVYATQKDQAGNLGTSAQHTGTIDTTPPNIVIDSFTTSDNTPLLSGRGEYCHGMLEIFYEDASHQYVSLGTTMVAPNGTWQFQVPFTVPAATYHLRAEQTDDAVNHGIGYGTVTVVAGLTGNSSGLPEFFQFG